MHTKFALRVAAANADLTAAAIQADGSVIFLARPGCRAPEIVLQAVPIVSEDSGGITLGEPEQVRRISVRTGEPKRHRIWLKI